VTQPPSRTRRTWTTATVLAIIASAWLWHGTSARQEAGRYGLTINKSGSTYTLAGKPDPLPYELDDFTRQIVWRFTNSTSGPLEVSLQSFECGNVPVSECPLDMTPPGAFQCSSGGLALKPGETAEIMGVENSDATCSTGFFSPTHLWDYAIQIVDADGIHRPDPQLQIDREFPFMRIAASAIGVLLLIALIWWWLRSRG
jgi:hypothetical protein